MDRERASELMARERRRVEALVAELLAVLSELEAAAERLESGAYGRCEVCGEEIPAERLEAAPATRYCLATGGAEAAPVPR
ncbi:MAG: TraR/DksA C4-type zinc finger protein [Acidimicrobiia bacterium]